MDLGARLTIALAAALAAAAGCEPPGPEGRPAASTAPLEAGMTLVATLGEGDGPDEVTLRPWGREVAASGPQGLAAAPDGTVLVADTLGGRILRLRPGGPSLPPLSLPGVEDVLVDDSGAVHGFDRAGRRVASFSPAGRQAALRALPATARWVAGLALDPTAGLAVRTAYQESAPIGELEAGRGLGEGVPGRDGRRYRAVRRGREARVEVVEQVLDEGAEPRWRVVSRLAVEVASAAGSLAIVGVTADSVVVVDVQEVVSESPVTVDRWVRRYGPEGELVGEVAVPRGSYAPAHALALAPDGRVLALRPTEAGVEVWAWPEGGAR